MKTWSIGPVYLLVNKHEADKVERGTGAAAKAAVQQDQAGCWKWKAWLDSKQTNSVLSFVQLFNVMLI